MVMILNVINNKASDDDEAEKFDYRSLCINRHDPGFLSLS